MKIEPKVILGIVGSEKVPTAWAINLINLARPPVQGIIFESTKPLDRARNQVIERFLVDYPYATHLLFIDTDILASHDAIVHMIQHDEPVVAGLYVQKMPPYYPLMNIRIAPNTYRHMIKWDENADLVECDSAGLGFALIRRDVFQDMEPPWCWMSATSMSEDYYFFSKAQNLGYKVYVDTKVNLIHMGEYGFTINDFYVFQQAEIEKSSLAGIHVKDKFKQENLK